MKNLFAYVDVTKQRSVVVISITGDITAADKAYEHRTGTHPSKDSNIACYSDMQFYASYCERRKKENVHNNRQG